MRHATRRRNGVVPALLLAICLPACGGGSGGGVPGGGPPPVGDDPPTLTVLTPAIGIVGLLGDTVRTSFRSDDDRGATVRILADADGLIATTADQVLLWSGTDGDGSVQDVPIMLQPPLKQGVFTLFLEADDGVNAPVVVAPPQGLVVAPGLAGVAPPRSNRYGVTGRVVVFSRGEWEDGAGPLNADGLADDGIAAVYDAATGTLTQSAPGVSMDVTGAAGGRVRPVLGDGGVLAWLTLEADENLNLNAVNAQNPVPPLGGPDPDQADVMVSYVNPVVSPLPVTNTYGGANAILGIAGGRILVQYAEAGEGFGGTVLNADGDALDLLMGYIDPAAPGPPYEFNQIVFHSLLLAPTPGLAFRNAQLVNAGWLAVEAGGPALFDITADGDQADTVLALGDLLVPGGAGVPANFATPAGVQGPPFPQPATPVDLTGGFDVTADLHAGYYIDEASDNLPPGLGAGNDRNGDLLIGMVAAFYDVTLGIETIPAGVAGPVNSVPGSPLIYDGTRMFFTGVEAPRVDPAPGTNGDGDGGTDFNLLYWTDHGLPAPVATPLAVNFGGGFTLTGLSLDLGGSMTRLAPGWLAVTVNELANGAQDINGSGLIDMAYLLVDTQAMPAPVVHNPGIVPSFTATFPLAGLYAEDPGAAARGVVVRLTEPANGNLDGDGNATEIFFAYISFATPTSFLLLDGGGDHCAVGGGRIGITAIEAYTGEDYDGNGAATGTVFRVFDFSGAVLAAGLPCSALSVPVTDTGELWAYLRDEVMELRNLNLDGDQTDLVLGLWMP